MKKLIIGLALITFANCNNQKKKTQSSNNKNHEIENIRWSLTELNGKPIPETVFGKVHLTLSEEDKKLTGYNGCNRLMGSYEISNELQISFSNIASTRKACNNENWDELEFNKTIESVNNFSISGNKLMFNIGKRAPLAVFTKIDENGITNKYWKLKKLNGKEVKMTNNQMREQYIIIKNNGDITGFSGCNQFSGKYILDESKLKIKFENVISTLRACPEAEINETDFLKIFELTNNYSINADTLMLNVGKRAPLAEFEAIYF